MVVLDEREDLVADEGDDVGVAVVGAGFAPVGVAAVVVVEVHAAVGAVAVELPDGEVVGAVVVVDDVHDDRDARLVARLHEAFEAVGASEARLGREKIRWIVTPRAVARELGDGHHFDGGDTELLQVGNLVDGRVERCRQIALAVEGADVHFVDDEVVAVDAVTAVGAADDVLGALPVEEGVVVDVAVGVPGRGFDLHGAGILAPVAVEDEFVLLPVARTGHVHRPDAVAFGGKLRTQPSVELAGDFDLLGGAGPDAEGGAGAVGVGVGDGAHAGASGFGGERRGGGGEEEQQREGGRRREG